VGQLIAKLGSDGPVFLRLAHMVSCRVRRMRLNASRLGMTP
jgi:hypothetical protein